MSSNKPLILSMDVIYSDEPVKLLNLKPASQGIFEAFVHPLKKETEIESGSVLFSADDIYLPTYGELQSACEGSSKYIFLALFIRANSMRESMQNDIEELNTAFFIDKGKIIESVNSPASTGYEEFFTYSFDKMQELKADWGIFTEFGTDNETGKQGIIVEVAHPKFGRIYISTVSFDDKLNSINVNTFDTKLVQEGSGANWK